MLPSTMITWTKSNPTNSLLLPIKHVILYKKNWKCLHFLSCWWLSCDLLGIMVVYVIVQGCVPQRLCTFLAYATFHTINTIHDSLCCHQAFREATQVVVSCPSFRSGRGTRPDTKFRLDWAFLYRRKSLFCSSSTLVTHLELSNGWPLASAPLGLCLWPLRYTDPRAISYSQLILLACLIFSFLIFI